MHNLTYFGVGLLLSVITITGFGHILLVGILLIVFSIGVAVKNKSSRDRLLCLWLGSIVGILSIGYTLLSDFSQDAVSIGQVVTVQLQQQLKPDMMTAYVVSGSQVSDTLLLVQGAGMYYPSGTFAKIVIDDLTHAGYPTISLIKELSWYPSSFEYSRRLAMKGYVGHVQTHSHIAYPSYGGLFHSSIPWNTRILSIVQSHIQQHYSQRTAGLLEGMIVGGRARLTQQEYDAFVQSGLVHIIAVSGSNIMMVVVLLGCVLFWLPLYIRTPVLIVGIVLYSIIVGLDSSVQRALVMGSTMLVAILAGRRISIRRSLWYACIVLVVCNPWSVLYDIGFVLSFGALIGILLLLRLLSTLELPGLIRTYILPSLGATLGVLPVLVVAMDGINILSPLVNIVVVPFIPIILLLGIAGSIVAFPFVQIVEYLVGIFFSVSSWTAEHALMLEVSTTLSKLFFVIAIVVLYKIISLLMSYSNVQILRT